MVLEVAHVLGGTLDGVVQVHEPVDLAPVGRENVTHTTVDSNVAVAFVITDMDPWRVLVRVLTDWCNIAYTIDLV